MKHLAKTLMIAAAALAAAAQAADPVPYLDPVAHTTNTCETYTLYTGQTTLDTGWYVVAGDITNNTRIAVDGDAHLILCDGASLTANEGVNVDVDGTTTNSLTIWAQSDGAAMGALTAQGGSGTGAGSDGQGQDAGRITINGGTVAANGVDGGAGIGSGYGGAGGTVTVNGGTVAANGALGGAGIGGGMVGSGGTVTISGGSVTATGSMFTVTEGSTTFFGGAGIGGGAGGAGGEVTVSGGTVTAIPGTQLAQAIGGGYGGTGASGSLSIPGMKVYASKDNMDADMPVVPTLRESTCRSNWAGLAVCEAHNDAGGDGVCDRCGTSGLPVPYLDPTDAANPGKVCTNYTAYAGETTLTSGWWVVAGTITNGTYISVFGDAHLLLMDGAALTVVHGINVGVAGGVTNSLTIWAQSDATETNSPTGRLIATSVSSYASIGGDSDQDAGKITINGGMVTATGGDHAAGIGGGNCGAGGMVTIRGGHVEATGGGYGAGIGGGSEGDGGIITIEGGMVKATGGVYISANSGCGAGIGGGGWASGGKITITGGTVTASAEQGAEAIGRGDDNDYTGSGTLVSGDLTLGAVRVTAPEGTLADDRETACRGTNVTLKVCHPHEYENDGCKWCDAATPDPPAVSNIAVTASAPWDGTVSISFDAANSPARWCPTWNQPYLSIVATDNLTGSNYVSAASALSARAPYQLADALAGLPGPHEVTWDFTAQGINFSSTNVTFTVAYLRMPDYCVIDLSGGTNAAHYAVSYLDAEPDGGFTNDLYRTTNLVMRLLAPGTFTMGGKTETKITNAFYCAVFETTQRQWELVMGANPSGFKDAADSPIRPVEMVTWNMIRGDAGTYDWPNVHDVYSKSFIGVLRRKTGLAALDLPTEAQWEYACRAGTTMAYSYGDTASGDYMWYNENSSNQTHVVGTKPRNTWDLYDMHGNVREWCLDPKAIITRVIRGGSWASLKFYCVSSCSLVEGPEDDHDYDGFRLVRTLSSNLESERSAEAAAGAKRAGTVCAGTSAPVAVGMRDFADTDIRLTAYDAPYDGQPHTIGVETNAIAGLELKYCAIEAATGGTFDIRQSTSAPPEYTNVCDMVVYVEASAHGYFTKTNSAAVRITPRSIADATIATIPVQYYEGAALTPAVSVLCGGRQLAVGVDFDASYAANDAPGTATITLTGKGNYTNETSATFQILPAPRSLAVTAGRWGRVAVVVDGATNWIAAGAADVPVGYGSSVTVAAVPDAGFAAAGPAGDLSFSSYTENTNLVFSFVPNPAATLRWKFSSAVGRYFAQVAIPAHAGYDEALGGLAFLFADRTNAVGDVYAQLWDAAARAPQGVFLTDHGVAYRGVALDPVAFAGKAENARVLWGVADASFNEPRNIVPAGERQIGLYVRKRVDPVSGNETIAEVGNFLGYLTWMTDNTRWFLPVVEGGAAASPSQGTPSPRPNASFSVSYRPYAPATLNAALALGLGAEAVADNPPKARIAEFGVGADGSVSGRVEAVAGGEASSSFGAATVRILSAETPAGPWREVRAEVDQATGAFSLPAGAVTGHFFRAEVETRMVLE